VKKHLVLAALAVSIVGCSTVDTGYRGVVLDYGKPTGDIKSEGVYFYNPISTSIVEMNVQIQSAEHEATAVSRDLQKIDTKITVNYNLDPGHVVAVYDALREEYASRIIAPTLQEIVKAVTARFTASELITRREEAKAEIEAGLRKILEPYGIHVDQVLITDFQFSQDFANAVEAKVTAQQNLITAQTEAQTAIATARGNAEAQRLQRLTLTPDLIQLKAIDKWDGHLPNVTGTTPFLTFGTNGFMPSERR
jgi:regulator of protease activity HflC (stomatin/prohibitin superfamily)